MDFEKISRPEKTVALILTSFAEQLADEVDCELNIIESSTDTLTFQPLLIEKMGSPQRIGPSKEFVKKFMLTLLQRLESAYPETDWEMGCILHVFELDVATIQVDYQVLNN